MYKKKQLLGEESNSNDAMEEGTEQELYARKQQAILQEEFPWSFATENHVNGKGGAGASSSSVPLSTGSGAHLAASSSAFVRPHGALLPRDVALQEQLGEWGEPFFRGAGTIVAGQHDSLHHGDRLAGTMADGALAMAETQNSVASEEDVASPQYPRQPEEMAGTGMFFPTSRMPGMALLGTRSSPAESPAGMAPGILPGRTAPMPHMQQHRQQPFVPQHRQQHMQNGWRYMPPFGWLQLHRPAERGGGAILGRQLLLRPPWEGGAGAPVLWQQGMAPASLMPGMAPGSVPGMMPGLAPGSHPERTSGMESCWPMPHMAGTMVDGVLAMGGAGTIGTLGGWFWAAPLAARVLDGAGTIVAGAEGVLEEVFETPQNAEDPRARIREGICAEDLRRGSARVRGDDPQSVSGGSKRGSFVSSAELMWQN